MGYYSSSFRYFIFYKKNRHVSYCLFLYINIGMSRALVCVSVFSAVPKLDKHLGVENLLAHHRKVAIAQSVALHNPMLSFDGNKFCCIYILIKVLLCQTKIFDRAIVKKVETSKNCRL